MATLFGMVLMFLGGANFAWFLLWAMISGSGILGAKLSKKAGTDNEKTDDAIASGKEFAKKSIYKSVTSVVMFGLGALLYFVVGK